MRQAFFLLLTLFSLAGFGQSTSTQYLGAPKTLVLNRGELRTDSSFQNAIRDTTFTPSRLGTQVFRSADSSLYVSVATTVRPYWAKVGSTGGSGAVVTVVRDSIFITTRDTVYAFSTAIVDSTVYATRAWRQKGDDSLAALIQNFDTIAVDIDTFLTFNDTAWIKKGGTTPLTADVTIAGGGNYTRFNGGRLMSGQGASIAAANNLTLGNDGNTFPITGNTQINAITTNNWQAGSTVNLIFSGSPTVKHNTAGGAGTAVIDLAGDVDWTAGNGDVLTLLYDGTVWHETTRKVAGSNGGRGTVTSFSAGDLSPLFTTTESNVSSTPALSFSLSNAGANTVFGNHTGSSAAPTFGKLPVGSVDATGTPSSTTYLRGDGTWSTPAGGGGAGMAIGGSITSATPGSNLYVGTNGFLQQSNSDWFYDSTNKRVGIGLNSSLAAKLHIKGAGTTSTTYGLQVHNSTGSSNSFIVRDDGKIGIGTASPATKLSLQSDALGSAVTGTSIDGITLENTTAATAGAPSVSPAITFIGRDWLTSGSSSNAVAYRLVHLPKSTSQNAGSFYLNFIQGGLVTNVGVWDESGYTQAGNLTASSGSVTTTGTAAENTFASGLYLNHASTGRYLRFNGNGGTIRAVIGHANTTGDLQLRVNDAISMASGTLAMNVVQNSGAVMIGTSTTDDKSALLNVNTTTKGFLPPRMTQAQRDAINLTVTSVTINTAGSGYSGTVTVSATDPGFGGTKATFNNAVLSGGGVSSITVNVAGSYNTAPTITISGNGTGATATANMTQVLTTGLTIYCTNCTATDGSTGTLQAWNGTTWKNAW